MASKCRCLFFFLMKVSSLEIQDLLWGLWSKKSPETQVFATSVIQMSTLRMVFISRSTHSPNRCFRTSYHKQSLAVFRSRKWRKRGKECFTSLLTRNWPRPEHTLLWEIILLWEMVHKDWKQAEFILPLPLLALCIWANQTFLSFHIY